MRYLRMATFLFGCVAAPTVLKADETAEVSLFDLSGEAKAYVALDDELTVYLWNGTPVAYLKDDESEGGYHLYGFNGNHLGWFADGVVWNNRGEAACAVKARLRSTHYEPYKGYKKYKPYKSYTKYAPYRPAFSTRVADAPCEFLLASGSK